MKRSMLFISLSLALLVTYTIIHFQLKDPDPVAEKVLANDPPPRILPGEFFVRSNMVNEDGTLKTNLRPQSNTNQDVAVGDETLSESIGLWLLYAIEKNDQTLFNRNVQVLKAVFLKEKGWISWKAGGGQPEISTNALIDDLRIAEALYKAAYLWEIEEYLDLANSISQSITTRNVVDGMFVDFYDIQSDWSNNVLTLSYLNSFALAEMYQQQQISEGLYQQTISFLQSIPLRHHFFPFSYDLLEQSYNYHDEVNLIDQLYILYHQVYSGVLAEEFWEFLKEAFYNDGLIYGRYFAQSKKPAVEYESPAVYGLAILSALEMGDHSFAEDLYYRMLRYQTLNPESELYGGYIDTSTKDTHIFDNLIPLLAERKMYNAGLLR